jgi:hypothetical protein
MQDIYYKLDVHWCKLSYKNIIWHDRVQFRKVQKQEFQGF